MSGVQAATTIDISPHDSAGEREVTEDEPVNLFAFAALAGTIVALGLTFGKARDREAVVWFSAASAVLLWGFFVYGFFRTIGNVLPEIGLVAAIGLSMAAAWTAVEAAPRWIVAVGTTTLVALVVGAFYAQDPNVWNAWLFLGFYAGGVLTVFLSVAAIRASVRGEREIEVRLPSTGRMAVAGIVGVAVLVAVGIGGPWLAATLLDGSGYEGASSIESSLAATTVLLVLYVAASVGALVAGSAIVHGRGRRTTLAPMQQVRA